MKYYRVIKDTPLWAEGAILEFSSGLGSKGGYKAIEELWDTPEGGLQGEYLSKPVIENNPEYFERVYKMSTATKAVYVAKEKAREMATKFYKAE